MIEKFNTKETNISSQEIWKALDGIFDEFKNYAISNFGNIKNNNTSYIISKNKDKDGYFRSMIYNCDKKRKSAIIHRLVAYMFKKESYKDGLVVNHINHVRDDNRVENLEWITKKENNSRQKVSKAGYEKNTNFSIFASI